MPLIDDRLVIVTKDISRNMNLIHRIIPKEILAMKTFDIVDEDQLVDDKAIRQLLLHVCAYAYLLHIFMYLCSVVMHK